MRLNRLVPAAFILFVSGPAFAQDWIEYTSNADFFTVNFPGEPKVRETIYRSEYGYDLPARVYSAEAGESRSRVRNPGSRTPHPRTIPPSPLRSGP